MRIEKSGEKSGGLELFFHILGMSSSQLTFIFFRGVGQPPKPAITEDPTNVDTKVVIQK